MAYALVGQITFQHIKADAKDTQVAPVRAVDQATFAVLNGLRAEGNNPDIEKSDSQSQARQAQGMVEASGLQVKAMSFEVGEHLFDPHANGIEFSGFLCRWEVDCYEPRLRFALVPESQEARREDARVGMLKG